MNLNGFDVQITQTSVGYTADTEAVYEFFENEIGDVAKPTPVKRIPDVLTPIDFTLGENAIIVWLEYSIGDSFGWYVNRETCVIGMFRGMDSAATLRRFIQGHYKNSIEGNPHDFSVTTLDGQQFEIKNVPWVGEFERLENVYLSLVRVE